MQVLGQLLVSGIAVGMIYGVIAFGYQLTFATSKTLNFGQGEALMLGALVGLTLVAYTGFWLMLPLVLAFGLLQGAVVEWLAVRQAIKTKTDSGWIMATIALGIIGGWWSGLGAVVGGLILGIAETTTGYYISTGYKDVPGLVLLLLVLTFKPAGLFGKSAIKKV